MKTTPTVLFAGEHPVNRDAGIRAASIELSVHQDLSLPPHLPYLVNLAFTPVVGGVSQVPVMVCCRQQRVMNVGSLRSVACCMEKLRCCWSNRTKSKYTMWAEWGIF